MDLIIALGLFLALLAFCLIDGVTMLVPLCAGLILFSGVAIRRGHTLRAVVRMMLPSVRDSLIVIRIMLIIGLLTGLWRASGTIACFVSWGVRLMPASLFYVSSFILASVMSFALGTSFGVSATCGVILMAVARASGANELLAAGAILSGVYVGDRGSPAASSASLIASLTGTDVNENIRALFRHSLVPYAACLVIFTVLSLLFPASGRDLSTLESIENGFDTSLWCLLPALVMIALPFLRVKIIWSMVVSIALSFACALFVQRLPFKETLLAALTGYTPRDPALISIFSGGGLTSMLEVAAILLVSGTYGGLFRGAGLLDKTDALLQKLSHRLGRYGTVLVSAYAACALFCNQTIGSIMTANLTQGLYAPGAEEDKQRMMDLEDSAIVLAGLVPWCIAFSVPAGMLGAGIAVIPFNCYLYLVPLWGILSRHIKEARHAKA